MATPTRRLRLNLTGSTTNKLTFSSATTTTGTWTSAPSLPAIATPTYLPITIGTEIVWLTSYSGSGTSGTFKRGMEGTTAASHSSGAAWGNNPTVWDSLLGGRELYAEPYQFQSVLRDNLATTFTPGTKKLILTPIFLPVGFPVGHLAFGNKTTAASSPSHWWFGLYNQTRVQLAVTADQATAAWSGFTLKSLAIAKTAAGTASTFKTTYTGLYFVGFSMTASSVVNLMATLSSTVTPVRTTATWGTTSGTHTIPPTFPFTAGAPIATAGGLAWAAVTF